MAVVDVNDARLEYTDVGQGEPLVFVHGSLEDLRIWRRQVELFSAHFRVVAYSRRYHHPNAAPGVDDPAYTASLHAADLADLIEKLDLAPGAPGDVVLRRVRGAGAGRGAARAGAFAGAGRAAADAVARTHPRRRAARDRRSTRTHGCPRNEPSERVIPSVASACSWTV